MENHDNTPNYESDAWHTISELEELLSGFVGALQEDSDVDQRVDTFRFKIGQAAEMVGREPQTIRDCEKDGKLPKADLDDHGRRRGYTLAQVNHMRRYFNTTPWRKDGDPPAIVAIQNLKGGVAKTTLACHAAQFFALKGYRTLLVDCDAQGSSTSLFGYNPDFDISGEETVYPYLIGEGKDSLHYAVRKTHFDQLDLIPANLELQSVENVFMGLDRLDRLEAFYRLRQGLTELSSSYDIVLLDPPPSANLMMVSVVMAANAVAIPVEPENICLSSTSSFLVILRDMIETSERWGQPLSYSFAKFIFTKVRPTIFRAGKEVDTSQSVLRKGVARTLGHRVFEHSLLSSTEFDTATSEFRTIFEHVGPKSKTYQRCFNNLTAVLGELESYIRASWPSHETRLREQGKG